MKLQGWKRLWRQDGGKRKDQICESLQSRNLKFFVSEGLEDLPPPTRKRRPIHEKLLLGLGSFSEQRGTDFFSSHRTNADHPGAEWTMLSVARPSFKTRSCYTVISIDFVLVGSDAGMESAHQPIILGCPDCSVELSHDRSPVVDIFGAGFDKQELQNHVWSVLLVKWLRKKTGLRFDRSPRSKLQRRETRCPPSAASN